MSYRIKIEYITGDSFHSYDVEKFLEGSWKNLEIVKENLKRIKEHHQWSSNRKRDMGKNAPSFVKYNKTYEENSPFALFLDNGLEYLISPFWVGYFEHLKRVSIEMDQDNDMCFSTGW